MRNQAVSKASMILWSENMSFHVTVALALLFQSSK